MRADYNAAKKLGDDAVKAALKNGISPYLPVLDTIEEVKRSSEEVHLGLMELPLSRITGNKTESRNNAFANNFMPLLDEGTEFCAKWSALYDSYVNEGIRDAISVYEYMHRFYVLEGNKRVSVSKYGGSEFILADVIRILPEKNDSKDVKAYYEYLDFYRLTKNINIVLTEPGGYEKLAMLLGQDLKNEWPEQLVVDLRSAYFIFRKMCTSVLKVSPDFTMGDAFLIYISIFPMKTLFSDTDETIVRNIRSARNELLTNSDVDKILFLDSVPEKGERPSGIMSLLSGVKIYSSMFPLKVGFVYDVGVEESRWTDSHEAGRMYLEEMTGDDVVTASYISGRTKESIAETIENAVNDKNEVIFTISPFMMSEALKAAIKHPNVKFLNCSIGDTSSSVRCYQGKFYEASFLMGILAADVLLREFPGSARRIGYLARNFGNMSMANLNAFAIGVSLIDPDCTVSLKYCGTSGGYDYKSEWETEGVLVFADFDYSITANGADRPGVYKHIGGKDVFIGTPYYNWGRYYAQIVRAVLYGSWNIKQLMNAPAAANYWFGLSTGVVDIRVGDLPYQTRKMLAFFKDAIINGSMHPFSGELHSQSRTVQEQLGRNDHAISLAFDTMSAGKIAVMDWMNENIE